MADGKCPKCKELMTSEIRERFGGGYYYFDICDKCNLMTLPRQVLPEEKIIKGKADMLLDTYEIHFKNRMKQYWGKDERFYQEYYGYLRVVQDLKTHLLYGDMQR